MNNKMDIRDDATAVRSVAFAIIAQAVDDVKALRRVGILRDDGTLIDEWPKVGRTRERQFRVIGMAYMHQARELLEWFVNGSLEDLLDLAQSHITAEAIRNKIGIRK